MTARGRNEAVTSILLSVRFVAYHSVGDIDNDGDLDLLVARGSWQRNKVYINNGSGNLTEVNQFIGRGLSQFITLGDQLGRNTQAGKGKLSKQKNKVKKLKKALKKAK